MEAITTINRNLLSKLLLFVAIAYLVASAILIRRDYQDSWALEGLELPFIFFISAFLFSFLSEKKLSYLVILAVIGRLIFILVPALKYGWFPGGFIDQQMQYNLASYIASTGRISSTNAPSFTFYVNTPLLHVLFSEFSMVLNVPVQNIMQYLPLVFGCIYPPLTYVLVKLVFPKNDSITKFVLLISAIPLSFFSYIVTGTLFGMFLAFITLYLIVSVIAKKDRRYWVLCIFFVIGLAAAHSVSSVVLAVILALIFVLQKVPFSRLNRVVALPAVLTIASISASWLMFHGISTLTEIANDVFLRLGTGSGPRAEAVPDVLFSLVRVDLLAASRTVIVREGADLFALFLACVGIAFILFKRPKLADVSRFMLVFCCLSILGVFIGLGVGLGPVRFLFFVNLSAPFFIGYAVYRLHKKWKGFMPIVFACLIALATIQVYSCDVIYPQANILYDDLPATVPIANTFTYNSAYQRAVAKFVVTYVSAGIIAADEITLNQITAVSNNTFAAEHYSSRYYPLGDKPVQGYNFFVTHLPGKAGVFSEPAQSRSPTAIAESVQNDSVIYNNGESYVLLNTPVSK
ncbi:MAG: hypothetical protein NWF04_03895 [Candidatus Bathyarchaeota archaeon]|nr:hypothetical protein [Candidatus Bathyarchaeota archaeon]